MQELIQESGHFQTIMLGNGYYTIQFSTFNNRNFMFVLSEREFQNFFPAGTPDSLNTYYIEIQRNAHGNDKLYRVEQDEAEEVIYADEMPEIIDLVSDYKGDPTIMELQKAQARVDAQLEKFSQDDELIRSVEEARESDFSMAEELVTNTIADAVPGVEVEMPEQSTVASETSPQDYDWDLDKLSQDDDDDGDF